MKILFFAVCEPKSPHLVGKYIGEWYWRFQRRFPIDDIVFSFGGIRDQIAKSEISPRCWCFWAGKFFWGETSKFLTQF